jgi:hypothetical protein
MLVAEPVDAGYHATDARNSASLEAAGLSPWMWGIPIVAEPLGQRAISRGMPTEAWNFTPTARKDTMDKLVKRVTVVQGSGEHRTANVVYKSDEDDDGEEGNRFERTIRHVLKAQVIAAQEAYQRHLDSVAKGGKTWIFDEPSNLMKAQRKAMKEIRKASPFKIKIEKDEDEDEGD